MTRNGERGDETHKVVDATTVDRGISGIFAEKK